MHEIENDKDAFFTRLYDQHGTKIVTEEAIKALHESNRLNDIANSTFRSGGGFGGKTLVVNAEQEAQTINRLLESKAKVETKVHNAKVEGLKSVHQLQHSRFIQQKSDLIANKAHSKALGEIFTVLCITALQRAEQQQQQQLKSNQEASNNNDGLREGGGYDENVVRESSSAEVAQSSSSSASSSSENEILLDVSLAQPHLLQPKVLADAMGQVLNSLLTSYHVSYSQPQASSTTKATSIVASTVAVTDDDADAAVDNSTTSNDSTVPPPPPLCISKNQFINEVLHQMATGKLPPIGYILTQPERESKPVRQQNAAKLMKSEDLAVLHCKPLPEFAAKKTTDMLVKGRYKLRLLGQESVEDSLLSCKSDLLLCVYYWCCYYYFIIIVVIYYYYRYGG